MNLQAVKQAVSSIPSYILDADIEMYYKYANEIDNGFIFDAGTGLGKSAIALALSNPTNEVHTYDNVEYPLARQWTNSKDCYAKEMREKFCSYQNIYFGIDDVLDSHFNFGIDLDIVHIDGEIGFEEKALKQMFPQLKKGGIALVRNYNRFKEKADEILKGNKYLEFAGQIQVVRKV